MIVNLVLRHEVRQITDQCLAATPFRQQCHISHETKLQHDQLSRCDGWM